MNKSYLFQEAVIKNPVLIGTVGLCPVVAICTSLKAAVIMSVITILTLIVAQVLSSLLLRHLSQWLRMGLYTLIGMAIVVPSILVLNLISPQMMLALGIYLPLLSVNPIVVRQCEREGVKIGVGDALLNSLYAGLGYSLVLIITGFIREIIGSGTIWGFKIFPVAPIPSFLMPMGGFIIIAFLAATLRAYFKKIDPEYAEELAVNSRTSIKKGRNVKSVLLGSDDEETYSPISVSYIPLKIEPDEKATPVAPVVEAPAAPVVEPLATPAVEAPAAPVVEAPTAPVVEAPAAPVVEAPAVPVVEAPAAPVVEAPAAPVVEAPAAPVVEAPAVPVVEAPAAPVVEAPAAPVVEAPAVSAVEAPAVPASEAPKPKNQAKGGTTFADLVKEKMIATPVAEEEAHVAPHTGESSAFKPKSAPKPESKSAAKQDPNPEPKPEPKAEPAVHKTQKFEFITLDLPSASEKKKAESKPEPKPEPKVEVKVEPAKKTASAPSPKKTKKKAAPKQGANIVYKSDELEKLMSLSLDDILNGLDNEEKPNGEDDKK